MMDVVEAILAETFLPAKSIIMCSVFISAISRARPSPLLPVLAITYLRTADLPTNLPSCLPAWPFCRISVCGCPGNVEDGLITDR